MITVRDVMHPDVISVAPSTSLRDVARILVDHGISGVPVVDDLGGVVGVVSEGDFLIREESRGRRARPLDWLLAETESEKEERAKSHAVVARDAMTAPAITIEPFRPVHDAARLMVEHSVNRLPVVEDGRLVGIITRADIVRSYVQSDTDLARYVRDNVILAGAWVDPAGIEVTSTNGIVSITGTVARRSDADVVARLVAQLPGVVAVDSQLRWQEDDTGIGPEQYDPTEPKRALG